MMVPPRERMMLRTDKKTPTSHIVTTIIGACCSPEPSANIPDFQGAQIKGTFQLYKDQEPAQG